MFYFNRALTRVSALHVRSSVQIRKYRGSLVIRFRPAPIPDVAEPARKVPRASWTADQLSRLKAHYNRLVPTNTRKLPWYIKILWWYLLLTTIGALILLDYHLNYQQYVLTGDEHLLEAIQGWFITEVASAYAATEDRLAKRIKQPAVWERGRWKFRRVTITKAGNPVSRITVIFLAFNSYQNRIPFFLKFEFSAQRIPCYELTQTLGPEFQEYILTLEAMKQYGGIWVPYDFNNLPLIPIQFKSRYYAEQFTARTQRGWKKYLYYWPWTALTEQI